ncbi:hypothetical protein JOF29_007273 [Kribbella aluminosa]|uniref:Uncharacterized protein n=1 Tax=Kribbella aluminosa TaxID=416017 RepID=A0ABS4UWX5_9ACTN|nr:hypothetical protein [Kribbella aluminosa]MBP2356163.1 hypothetical protein [Kribbella aluminosa]
MGLVPQAGHAAQALDPQAPQSACTLAPPASKYDESPTRCVSATVALDRVPAVGETATATVILRSEVDIPRAELAIRLPQGLRITSPGFSTPRTRGLDTVATSALSLGKSGRTVTFTVAADVTGPAQIQADLTDLAAPAEERSAHATEEITVGTTAASSKDAAVGTRSAGRYTNGSLVPQRKAAQTPRTAAAPDEICATGTLNYATYDGVWHPGRRFAVSAVGQATPDSTTTTLATGVTSAADGSYALCFKHSGPPLARLWVQFSTRTNWWEVTDMTGDNPYVVAVAPLTDVPAGTTQAFGTTTPDALHMRAFDAFDVINNIYAMRGSGTQCWTAAETTNCSKLKARWAPGNTNGGYYNTDPAIRAAFLTDAMPDARHPVVHEAGHNLQHLLYNWYWPAGDCPSPHSLHRATGAMCAWTEGFANAVAGYAMGDGRYYYNVTDWMDLMQTGFQDTTQAPARSNPDNGDAVEGRIAGAMIALWRDVDGGPQKTLVNMDNYASDTFDEWFNVDRAKSGLSVGRKARDVLYEHTIDYRDVKRRESVVNGGLEDQGAGWSWTGGVVGTFGYYPAHSGRYYAWMGGNGVPNEDTLSQTVAVPAKGTSLLGFYLRINSAEPTAAKPDSLALQVIDGNQSATVYTWYNTDKVPSYAHRVIDLSRFAGHTVTLRFVSDEDQGEQTDFLLDDISLKTS